MILNHLTLNHYVKNLGFLFRSTRLDNQLLEFKKRRTFSVVLDEYGEFLGIVTLEDIIEEIVGRESTTVRCTRNIKGSGGHKIYF